MENKSHALIAGSFTVLLCAALVIIALWMGRDRTEHVPYVLVTRASVAGLSVESPVRYRGVEVGKVEDIGFDPQQPGQVLVRISVVRGTPITHASFAQLQAQGVTGLSWVQLDDDGSSKELLTTDADHPARIALQAGLFDQLSGSSQAIVARVDEVLKRANELLAPENQKALVATLTSIDKAAQKAANVGTELQPSLAHLPQAIDTTRDTLAGLGTLAHDVDLLAVKLQQHEGTLDRVEQSLARIDHAAQILSQTTLPRYESLADDASSTARALTHTARALDSAPNTLLFGRGREPGPGEAGFVTPH